jgi:hypothetical protein
VLLASPLPRKNMPTGTHIIQINKSSGKVIFYSIIFDDLQAHRCAEEVCSGFSGGWVDDLADSTNAIGRESPLRGVIPYHLLVWSDVDTVDFVGGDIALHPLNLRPQFLQNTAGFLRNSCEFFRAERPGSGDISFNYIFRHGCLLYGNNGSG